MTELKEVFEMVTKQTEPDLDSWKQQEDRQRQRARRRKIGAFAVAAAIAAGAALLILVNRPAGDTTAPADTGSPSASTFVPVVTTHEYLDIATGEQSPVAANLTGARLPEVSPNGEAIAYNTFDGNDTIYVAQLDGSSRATITPDDLDGYGATWIDDETILFQGRAHGTSQIGDLYVANVSTGELTMVVDMPDVHTGAWIVVSDVSPDGSTVLYHLHRGKLSDATWDLWTAPLAGGEPTLLRKDAGFAAYAPDGSIVFLDHPVPFESDEIWIMDGDGKDARQLVAGGRYAMPRVAPDGTSVAYANGSYAEIVEIETGETTTFEGSFSSDQEPAWYGSDTLIIQ